MAETQLVTIAFRVHPALKRRIYQEAAGVRLKPSDYLRRRVEVAFDFDADVFNTAQEEPIDTTH